MVHVSSVYLRPWGPPAEGGRGQPPRKQIAGMSERRQINDEPILAILWVLLLVSTARGRQAAGYDDTLTKPLPSWLPRDPACPSNGCPLPEVGEWSTVDGRKQCSAAPCVISLEADCQAQSLVGGHVNYQFRAQQAGLWRGWRVRVRRWTGRGGACAAVRRREVDDDALMRRARLKPHDGLATAS